jgi:uncharacterized RDD family membrane protein YckC
MDWQVLAEALNLRVGDPSFEHPTFVIGRRILVAIIACVLVEICLMIVTQARWGMTPGKWLCGLRTVRTSLRPCGLAHSLARELVFLADCCSFLCWTLGIVSIALTEHRQRLGDLVADTLVIRTRP